MSGRVAPLAGQTLTRGEVEFLLRPYDGPGQQGPGSLEEGRGGFDLRGANLDGVDLSDLPLPGCFLGSYGTTPATMRHVNLMRCNLENAFLADVDLSGSNALGLSAVGMRASRAVFDGCDMDVSNLMGARLDRASFKGATVRWANLEGSSLWESSLRGCDLTGSKLVGADLRRSVMNRDTELSGLRLDGARVADVDWGGANLSTVDWRSVGRLGDEDPLPLAPAHVAPNSWMDQLAASLSNAQSAARAYSQLATALRTQGILNEAHRFEHRLRVKTRHVAAWQALLALRRLLPEARGGPPAFLIERYEAFDVPGAPEPQDLSRWRQPNWWIPLLVGAVQQAALAGANLTALLTSLLLGATCGHGYRPLRAVVTYFLLVMTFAAIYIHTGYAHSLGQAVPESVVAFHGRGFFGTGPTPGSPTSDFVAVEAAVGFITEIVFIAAFTRRVFGS